MDYFGMGGCGVFVFRAGYTHLDISDKDGMAETESYLKSGSSMIGFIASFLVYGGDGQGRARTRHSTI